MPIGETSLTSAPASSGKKYFTLHQANRSLCLVSRIVEDIHQAYLQAMEIRQQAERSVSPDDQEKLRDAYDQCMDHLNELMDELHLVGIEFRDFDMGLVDFPAMHEGREVYFSWKRGESAISFWHEADAGYTGRQDLSLLHAVG